MNITFNEKSRKNCDQGEQLKAEQEAATAGKEKEGVAEVKRGSGIKGTSG